MKVDPLLKMIADYLNLKAESLDSITISRNGVEIVLDVTKEREEQEAKKNEGNENET